jgi:death-on-curing protein
MWVIESLGGGIRYRLRSRNQSIKPAHGNPDIAQLAAAYAFAIIKDHPFVDGKKRTAFVALELFLLINGYGLMASEAEILAAMLGLATDEVFETRFARWVRTHIRR